MSGGGSVAMLPPSPGSSVVSAGGSATTTACSRNAMSSGARSASSTVPNVVNDESPDFENRWSSVWKRSLNEPTVPLTWIRTRFADTRAIARPPSCSHAET